MRRAALVLVGLVLLAGAACAQQPVRAPLRIEAEDFPGPVQPLADVASVNVTATADCALVSPDPLRPTEVVFTLREAPPWVVGTMTPGSVPIPTQTCQGTTTTVRTALSVTVTADAPAFTAESVAVEASVRSVEATYTAVAEVLLRAGFLSIVDVAAQEASLTVEPGDEARCVFLVTNFGNAPTRVILTPSSLADGWSALAPPPFVLGSAQSPGTGERALAQTLRVITTTAGVGSRTQTVDVTATSAYAEDASLQGDTAATSCIVTTRGGAAAPPAGLAGALLALGGVAAVRARRHA